MNRHLLSSSALHDFTDNSFVRRASLANPLNLTHSKKRPKIEIELNDQPQGFHVPSFTNLDRIHGTAIITAVADLPFDDIHISFQGTSRTWVEKIVTTAPTNPRTRAFHTFLRLMQPIEESDLPEQRILRAGRTYRIPFEFVVPDRLLPQSCSHARQNATVEEEHLKLPPSLGDAMVSGDGKSLFCDFSPEMTTITYSIRVIVTRKAQGSQTRPAILGDNQLKLRIIPKFDESPPLEISDEPGEDYVLKKCKNIKKGLIIGKTKVGALTVETRQPPPLHLPGVRSATNGETHSVMSMLTLKLRFDPTKANMKPPKLQTLWSRLKIATFFSTVPQKSLPSKSAAFSIDHNKGLMVDTLPLSSRCLGGQTWQHQNYERRDSAVAFALDQPSSPELELKESPLNAASASPVTTPGCEECPDSGYYTATVLVPIELPHQRMAFVPTFHSCLVSRIYALELTLNVSSGAGNSQTMHLKVPIQVTSSGSDNPVSTEGMMPEGGRFGARGEANDVFAPNAAAGDDETPPDFDEIPPLGGRRATYDLGALGQQASGSDGRSDNEVDSDGEYNVRRPTWVSVQSMGSNNPAGLAAEMDRERVSDTGVASPHAVLSRAVSPVARSPSPRAPRLTNDEILNTENYESPSSVDEQFGSFRWEPTEGPNGGNAGIESRRATEPHPPGYSSVAAGTMLIGTGGLIRALS